MYAVVRVYEYEHQARAAAAKVNEEGYDPEHVVVFNTSISQQADAPSLMRVMRAGGLVSQYAEFYEQQLAAGYTLVIVGAAFGTSREAGRLLDEYNPLPVSHEPTRGPFVAWYEKPAAFSTALRIPALTKSDTPLSNLFGLKGKQEGLSHFSRWWSPLTDWSFSEMIGMKFQAASDTPLSSKVGMSTSSDRVKGKSSTFGMPLLTKRDTPLSSLFGMGTKTKRKRILSSNA
ncbi:MAG: hypothetical protein AAGI24_14615 [Pseudomonadota bacterium]